tara:strand:+ start:168 stop:428 length:261 start_codon:yes stop_codon:yes gene_type:complete
MQALLKDIRLAMAEDGTYPEQKLKSSEERILLWATETEISILIDNKLYKKPTNKKQLLDLAQMFLSKAINHDFYKEFEYTKDPFKE